MGKQKYIIKHRHKIRKRIKEKITKPLHNQKHTNATTVLIQPNTKFYMNARIAVNIPSSVGWENKGKKGRRGGVEVQNRLKHIQEVEESSRGFLRLEGVNFGSLAPTRRFALLY